MPELRGQISEVAIAKLRDLQQLWGHSRPMETVAMMACEAHGRYLSPADFTPQVHRAVVVLKRCRGMVIPPSEILEVAMNSRTVVITVRLEPDRITVSMAEWRRE